MPTAVYDYMSKSKGIWWCDNCTEEVKNLMKDAVTPKTHQDISKMRTDLDKTVDSVKILMEDFYYFMNGTKNKAQPTTGSNANPWKIKPNVTKPLKDICNIRLLQSHMRLKKNRPYNHWLKGQGHHLLCFSTSRTVGASSVRL